MNDIAQLKARIDDLETRFTFQEELLESLNRVVTSQWHEIDRLTRALEMLQQQVEQHEQPEATGKVDERPPHY